MARFVPLARFPNPPACLAMGQRLYALDPGAAPPRRDCGMTAEKKKSNLMKYLNKSR